MSSKLQAWLCAVGLLISVPSLDAGDVTVAPGWDLFATDPTGTAFPGLGNLQGVPFGAFDFDNMFGRGIGMQNVGNTDTIIQRLLAATSVSGPIPITLVALQLETVTPVNFAGNGVDNYFITLQSARGGPASTGLETINFNGSATGGTFTSFFDVFFDIRKGGLNGPIVFSTDLVNNGSGTWTHTPLGDLLINGVNFNLKGDGTSDQDFFLAAPDRDCFPNGGCQTVNDTPSVPEPAGGVYFLAGMAGIFVVGRRISMCHTA